MVSNNFWNMKKRDGNVLPVAESFVNKTRYVIPATSWLFTHKEITVKLIELPRAKVCPSSMIKNQYCEKPFITWHDWGGAWC